MLCNRLDIEKDTQRHKIGQRRTQTHTHSDEVSPTCVHTRVLHETESHNHTTTVHRSIMLQRQACGLSIMGTHTSSVIQVQGHRLSGCKEGFMGTHVFLSTDHTSNRQARSALIAQVEPQHVGVLEVLAA